MLFLFRFPLFLCVSVSALALPSPPPSPPTAPLSICATDEPSLLLRNAHQVLRAQHRHDKLQRRQVGAAAGTTATPLVVDLYMHFVSSSDQAHRYNPQIIETMTRNQATVLNQAFAPANVTFLRKPPTYTINDAWSLDGTSSTTMKASLRQGTYSSLNLYFQTNLSTPAPAPNTPRTTLLGYCTLPTTITHPDPACPTCPPIPFPPTVYSPDGCNILASTLPGQTAQDFGTQGYNLGGTTVHEVGHWMGLLHTFQGNNCRVGDPGDFIDDTNQERLSTQGCPSFKDSCGLGPVAGRGDPIHNFMDYSNDFW